MTHSNRAYFLVPVIYVSVIFGLLFLQFSGGERFARSVGALTMHATRGAAGEDGTPSVRAVNMTFDGLSFDFADESGLIIETPTSLSDALVIGYDVRDDGFDLRFEGGYRLAYTVSSDPARELQLRLELPSDATNVRKISIPFQIAGEPADPGASSASFVTITTESGDFFFTVPPNASIDLENHKLVLAPGAAGQAIRYVEGREGDPARVVSWFGDESLAISDTAYASSISDFVDNAYRGWASGRYDSTRLAWNGSAGFTTFSEEALTAYLAEAWKRNEYDRAFTEMRRARTLHPDDLTLLSSAYLGNLREIRTRMLDADKVRIDRITEAIATHDPAIFREPGVFVFAADHGSEELYSGLLSFAEGVDLKHVDVITAIGMLRNVFMDQAPDRRVASLALRLVDLIQLRVLSSITRTDEGFFVQTAPGQIDLYQTALAGATLNAYGTSRNDRVMTMIGRNLVTSVLERADKNGMIPATLLVRGESVETDDGLVAPERLYPFLADAAAYPHETSLYSEVGSGHWAWSAANITPVRMNDSEWRFELSYPRLRTHYVIIQGVPTFDRMELFGQTWRDAPDFEIYSKGRHYNEESQTLMIKYYDDSVRREVALFF